MAQLALTEDDTLDILVADQLRRNIWLLVSRRQETRPIARTATATGGRRRHQES